MWHQQQHPLDLRLDPHSGAQTQVGEAWSGIQKPKAEDACEVLGLAEDSEIPGAWQVRVTKVLGWGLRIVGLGLGLESRVLCLR